MRKDRFGILLLLLRVEAIYSGLPAIAYHAATVLYLCEELPKMMRGNADASFQQHRFRVCGSVLLVYVFPALLVYVFPVLLVSQCRCPTTP